MYVAYMCFMYMYYYVDISHIMVLEVISLIQYLGVIVTFRSGAKDSKWVLFTQRGQVKGAINGVVVGDRQSAVCYIVDRYRLTIRHSII